MDNPVASALSGSDGPVARAALVLAVLSLAWQVISWRRDGQRLRFGITTKGMEKFFYLEDQNRQEARVVEVRNAGRGPTTIKEVALRRASLKPSRRKSFGEPYDVSGQPLPLPIKVDPGEIVSVYFKAGALRHAREETFYGGNVRVRAYCVTGHGTTTSRLVRLGRWI